MTSADKTRSPRRRLQRVKERGATLVEFAIVVMVLLFMLFIVIEGAFAVRARSTMGNAIDDAARRGAVASNADDADYQILLQLFGRGAGSVADVNFVAIYKTLNANDPVPASCKMGTSQAGDAANEFNGACNVYYPASWETTPDGPFDADPADFGCPAALGTQWCPDTRGDPDKLEFIGVYVDADYHTILQQATTVEFTVNVSGGSSQAIETSGESSP